MINKSLLNENEEAAIKEFSNTLKIKYGNKIKSIRLYGSKVRGDSDKFSDIDLFILVDEKNAKIRQFILDTAYELNLKYDVILSVIIYDEKGFNNPITQITPFIKNVIKEGVLA